MRGDASYTCDGDEEDGHDQEAGDLEELDRLREGDLLVPVRD